MNLAIKNKAENEIEIDLFGDIGESWFSEGITMQSVKDQIQNHSGKDLTVNVSSLGGDVNHGLAIYDILKSHKGTVTANIIGATASAGTIVALGADKVNMSENALFLVHNAWTMAVGNAKDLRETANSLDTFDSRIVNIYKKKTGKRNKSIEDLMSEEKWITAEEALDFGFIDKVYTPLKAAASVDYSKLINDKLPKLPEKFLNQTNMENKTILEKIEAGFNKIIGKIEEKKEDKAFDPKAAINTVKDELKNEFTSVIENLNTEISTLKTSNKTATDSIAEKDEKIKNLEAEVEKLKINPEGKQESEGSNPEGDSKGKSRSVFDFAAEKIKNVKSVA